MLAKLDIKDKKILNELDRDSRQSASQIARKVKLSKNAVLYRIEAMKKEDIIKNFHAVIDIGKLGYISFRMYLNIQNATPKKEEEIIEFLKKDNMITFLASSDGKYNLIAVGVTKNIYHINELWDKLLQKYVNYFGDRLITINIRSTHFSRAYLTGDKKNSYEFLTASSPEEIKIDSTDRAVIHLLSENARISVMEMSEKLRITPKTIISRIKKLKKNKIIVAYRVILDREKIGYSLFKVGFILMKLIDENARRIIDYVRSHPNVICREETLGGDDFEIDVEVPNIHELRKIITDVREKFGELILDYSILHVYKEHKNLFFHPAVD